MDVNWDELGRGDVVPLPLALETNWRPDHLELNVIIVLDQDGSGYTASAPIWSTSLPYDPGRTPAHAVEARGEALRRFARDCGALMKGMDSNSA